MKGFFFLQLSSFFAGECFIFGIGENNHKKLLKEDIRLQDRISCCTYNTLTFTGLTFSKFLNPHFQLTAKISVWSTECPAQWQFVFKQSSRPLHRDIMKWGRQHFCFKNSFRWGHDSYMLWQQCPTFMMLHYFFFYINFSQKSNILFLWVV